LLYKDVGTKNKYSKKYEKYTINYLTKTRDLDIKDILRSEKITRDSPH